MLTVTAVNITIAILLLILSYLIGAIPFGVIIGKLFCHKDIREFGSKNIGTTNTIRVLGKKIGFFVFLCDVLKGSIVMILIQFILEPNQLWESPIPYLTYGIAAVFGHTFPLYIGFKGGKGVATSLGVVLTLTPLPAILCLVCFTIVIFTTGYVSLGSTGATFTVLISTWVLYFVGLEPDTIRFSTWFIGKPEWIVAMCYSILGALILLKHIKNYKRLFLGTENNFKKKKETSPTV